KSIRHKERQGKAGKLQTRQFEPMQCIAIKFQTRQLKARQDKAKKDNFTQGYLRQGKARQGKLIPEK
ncbi:hypothetical protein P7K49_007541, partial [Saguinus oedipus]